MTKNKLSKKQLVGYIALCVLFVAISYFAIFSSYEVYDAIAFDVGNQSKIGNMAFFVWLFLLVIVSTLLCAVTLASFVFHLVQVICCVNEKSVISVGIEAVSLFAVLAITSYYHSALSSSDFGGNVGIGYSIVCSIFSLIIIAGCVAMLSLNTLWKKKSDKKVQLFFYIGMGSIIILSLAVLIPDFVSWAM